MAAAIESYDVTKYGVDFMKFRAAITGIPMPKLQSIEKLSKP